MKTVYLIKFHKRQVSTGELYSLFSFVVSNPINRRKLVDILESGNPLDIYHDVAMLGKYIETIKNSTASIIESGLPKQTIFIEHSEDEYLVISISQETFYEVL